MSLKLVTSKILGWTSNKWSWLVLPFFALGFFVGLFIMVYPPWIILKSDFHLAFLRDPEVSLWILLECILISFLIIIMGPMISSVIKLVPKLPMKRSIMVCICLSLLTIVLSIILVPISAEKLIPNFFDLGNQLPYVIHKMTIVYTLSIIVVTIVTTGMWFIQFNLKAKDIGNFQQNVPIRDYLTYRDESQKFLWVLGIILGLAILCTGTYFKMKNLSELWVLACGLVFSLIIILIYLPVYFSFIDAGRRLCESFAPLPSPYADSWQEAYLKTKNLEEYLRLNVSAKSKLQSGIAILTPLISGIVSISLPF